MHRNIKPENIMFKNKNDFEVSIIDFGLATKSDCKRYLFAKCGTPGFMAPEVINTIETDD